MRKRDRKELTRYVRHIADEMGLRDWGFTIRISDPAEDVDGVDYAFASIEPVDGRKYAVITFDPETRDQPPLEIRDTVCHELVHAHLNAACEVVRVDIVDWFPQATYELMFRGFRRNIETAVDGLAEALSPNMPLIEWPS